MTTEELRSSFVAFAGQPAARRFALQLRRDKEAEKRPPYRQPRTNIRFWQEQLWYRFTQRFDEAPSNLDQLRDALLWCDVHNCPLENGQAVADTWGVPDRDGAVCEALDRARDEHFPFGFGFWTLVCPACVKACREWMDNASVNRPQ